MDFNIDQTSFSADFTCHQKNVHFPWFKTRAAWIFAPRVVVDPWGVWFFPAGGLRVRSVSGSKVGPKENVDFHQQKCVGIHPQIQMAVI